MPNPEAPLSPERAEALKAAHRGALSLVLFAAFLTMTVLVTVLLHGKFHGMMWWVLVLFAMAVSLLGMLFITGLLRMLVTGLFKWLSPDFARLLRDESAAKTPRT